MSTESILDTIINEQQADTTHRLDVAGVIARLFKQLNEREVDIIKRRFGLNRPKKATLDEIGQSHNLTRERIRQIETSSIHKVKKLKELSDIVDGIRRTVSGLIKDHGGLMEKQYLFDLLFALDSSSARERDADTYRNHLDFILGKLLDSEFKEVRDSKYFNSFFTHHYDELDHLEELAAELVRSVKSAKNLFLTEELANHIGTLDAFKKHEPKLRSEDSRIEITDALREVVPSHDYGVAHGQKPLYSLLRALTEVDQNTFGHWGHSKSAQVKPKTINDKIHLVLKQHAKPMHYEDIAKAINAAKFDRKSVNTATVHNELILDEKYVLVGRGLYALKAWGYDKGTVADVIETILKKAKAPLSKKDITEQVLKQRMVKKTTIDLALMNKERFTRLPGAQYALAK